MNELCAGLARDIARGLERRGYRRVRVYLVRRLDLGAATHVAVVRRGYARRLHAWARGETPDVALRLVAREAGVTCRE